MNCGRWLFMGGWLILVLAGVVQAAEDPDRLFAEGQFAQAEALYTRLDMDHPQDLRYRYNRGVAAYEKGDLKAAESAFTSVLRRAEDDALRFRAAYNLGHVAFKKGDFEAAVGHFKAALGFDPASAEARYNLELALRERDKPAPNEEKPEAAPESGPGSETGETPSADEAERENPAPPGRPPGDGERPPEEAAETAGAQAPEQAPGQAGEQGPQQPPNQDQAPGQAQTAQREAAEAEETAPPSVPAEQMARQRAEALLDNVQENPARMWGYQVSPEERQKMSRGKDW